MLLNTVFSVSNSPVKILSIHPNVPATNTPLNPNLELLKSHKNTPTIVIIVAPLPHSPLQIVVVTTSPNPPLISSPGA